jgi:hypothetical protein
MSEYRFDRYRNGRRMVEGLVLTKPTSVDQAVAVAAVLAQSGEIYVMRQESRIAELEAERDAAKAEAARAVEALRTIAEGAQTVVPDVGDLCCLCGQLDDHNTGYPALMFDECADQQPALDWLARREREAVVRELNQLGPLGSSNQELFMVPWSEIKQRIAAITTQQPSACPRSEVWGVENNNA